MPVQSDSDPTRLRAARLERGWTQARAIAELLAQARALRIPIAEVASLKTMLSRWENGHPVREQVYRHLFCLIYEQDEDDLGFAAPNTMATRVPHVAPVLDAETVSYFQDVFWQHVRADNLMGPHHLVEVVRAQTVLLDEVLQAGRSDVHAELTRLACRYNEFTGWLYQDAGEPTNAMHFTDRAMDYALAYGNPTDIAYMLMRKTNISNDQASPGRALGLSEAGLRDITRVAPRIRALIYAQKARAHALSGDRDGCARAIEAAYREVTRPEADGDDYAMYCTPAYIQMEAAACWTEIGNLSRAVPIFRQALSTWPTPMRRDLGLCQARLAIAHAKAGDVTDACTIGTQAVTTAGAATSARTLRHLDHLRGALAPWRRDAQVSELNGRIKELTRAA